MNDKCNHDHGYAIQWERFASGACQVTCGELVIKVDRHPVFTMNYDEAMREMKKLLKIPAQ